MWRGRARLRSRGEILRPDEFGLKMTGFLFVVVVHGRDSMEEWRRSAVLRFSPSSPAALAR